MISLELHYLNASESTQFVRKFALRHYWSPRKHEDTIKTINLHYSFHYSFCTICDIDTRGYYCKRHLERVVIFSPKNIIRICWNCFATNASGLTVVEFLAHRDHITTEVPARAKISSIDQFSSPECMQRTPDRDLRKEILPKSNYTLVIDFMHSPLSLNAPTPLLPRAHKLSHKEQ